MQLYAVDIAVVRRYLDSPVLTGDQAARLLELRGISDGTPIHLDDETMMPVASLCPWGRNMSYADLAGSTLKDYGRIMARFGAHIVTSSRSVVVTLDMLPPLRRAFRHASAVAAQRPDALRGGVGAARVEDAYFGAGEQGRADGHIGQRGTCHVQYRAPFMAFVADVVPWVRASDSPASRPVQTAVVVDSCAVGVMRP
ncbi:hypothetical protein ACFWFZ_11265 [Streptomyces sp. NPDC060232]|uniref:hypothetical protein n=1 Tax=Streptomyces sp. NPDC060232 TaxID=3347079 RepID=UPI00365EC9C8